MLFSGIGILVLLIFKSIWFLSALWYYLFKGLFENAMESDRLLEQQERRGQEPLRAYDTMIRDHNLIGDHDGGQPL